MNQKPNKELFLPVYIDTKKLIDLNSIMFDGFAEFNEITYETTSANNSCTNHDSNIKIYKIGKSKESIEESTEKILIQKNHTPNSLLSQTLVNLRNYQGFNEINIGKLIELKGKFKNNSCIDLFEQIKELLEFFHNAEKLSQNKVVNKQAKTNQPSVLKNMIKAVNDMLNALSTTNLNFREFVYEDTKNIYIIHLDKSFTNDTTLNDIHNHQLYFLAQIKDITEEYAFFAETPMTKISPDYSKDVYKTLEDLQKIPELKLNFDLKYKNDKNKTIIVLDVIAVFRK